MREIKTVHNPHVDECYEGSLVDDQFHGKGTFYFANGNKYVGDWINNKRQGYGIMYFADGDRYEGEWMNDKMNGRGIYYFKSGFKQEGFFRNDKYLRQKTSGVSLTDSGRTNASGKISPNFFATGRSLTITSGPSKDQNVVLTANNVEGFEKTSIANLSEHDQEKIAVNSLLKSTYRESYKSYTDSENEFEESTNSSSSSLNGFSTLEDKQHCAELMAKKKQRRSK